MSKRTDQKKQRREEIKSRFKKTMALLFCIALLISAVYITDMSTRRMIMCNDDKYAAAVALQEDNKLRIDIAGEKFILDIEPVVKTADIIISRSRRIYHGLVETIRGKSD